MEFDAPSDAALSFYSVSHLGLYSFFIALQTEYCTLTAYRAIGPMCKRSYIWIT